jgi:hypothetical protein
MITNIPIVMFVNDVDRRGVYIDVLGFDADDITLGDGTAVQRQTRTSLSHGRRGTGVCLLRPSLADDPALQDEGGMHGLGLNVDDCQEDV